MIQYRHAKTDIAHWHYGARRAPIASHRGGNALCFCAYRIVRRDASWRLGDSSRLCLA